MKFWTLVRAAIVLMIASPLPTISKPATQSGGSPSRVEGTWAGILGAGATKLHLILSVTATLAGSLVGELNSVDQGANLVIQEAALDGDKFRFEIAGIHGHFEGVLNKSADELTGTWTQSGVAAQAPVFHRTATAPASESSSQAADEKKPAEHTPKPIMPPLDVVIPEPPHAFKTGGKWNLCYELHVVNYGKWDAALNRLEVLAADSSQKTLATFNDAALYLLIFRPGLDTVKKEIIRPGSSAVLHVWVTLDKKEDIPSRVRHRVVMHIGDYPEGVTLEGVDVAVNLSPVPVIAAPLVGDNWIAGSGPSNTSIHRRALIPVYGHAYISQRYAIDWVRLNPSGKTYTGDSKDNKNYLCYGAEIHAVADGVVTSTRDGIQQNVPNEPPAVPINLDTVGGNHVIMQIADNVYAFYAHMQPGSVRVKVGDHIRRGQVLGLVGNTGNSSEPHLHFHLCNANSELACAGLPYAFTSFDLQGNGWGWKDSDPTGPLAPASMIDTGSGTPGTSPRRVEMEIPAENDVVRFTP